MRSLYILISLFLFSLSSVIAQSPLERLLTDDENIFEYIALDIDYSADGTFYMFSAIKHKDSADYKRVNLTILNKNCDYKEGLSYDYFVGDIDNPSIPGDVTVFPEGNVNLVGENIVLNFTILEAGEPSHVYLTTDKRGNIIWSKVTGSDTLARVANERNILKYDKTTKQLMHSGSIQNSGTSDIFINFYDTLGIKTQGKKYNLDNNIEQICGVRAVPVGTTSAYLFCGMTDTLASDLFVTKLDSNTVSEWNYKYRLDNTTHSKGNAVDIIQMNDSLQVVAFNLFDDTGKQSSYLLGLDSLGNSLWTKHLSYLDTDCEITEIIKTQDTIFAISIKQKSSTDNNNLILAGFNTIGEKKWESVLKESFDHTYIDGGLKLSPDKKKIIFTTTGFDVDASAIDRLPLRYIGVCNLDGSTPCNVINNTLIVDSTGVYRESFNWDISETEVPSNKSIDTRFRQVIAYHVLPDPDKAFYCPKELVNILIEGKTEGGVEYNWASGEMTDSIRVFDVGEYSITVKIEDKYCHIFQDTFTTMRYDLPQVSIYPDDLAWCNERIIKLTSSPKVQAGLKDIKWSNGATTQSIDVDTLATFSVIVTDQCDETATASITLSPNEIICPNPLVFPNAFVPNEREEGFEKDKIFAPVHIEGSQDITSYNLIIVNRWGQVIFESDDFEKGWDGRYKDKNAVGGTYFYKAVYSTHEKEYEDKGGLELIK